MHDTMDEPEAGVWSIDAIHHVGDRRLLRMIKFHENETLPVGMRYLTADASVVAGPEVHGEGVLDHGRSFRVPWKKLLHEEGPERHYRVTQENLEAVSRQPAIEQFLQTEIASMLDAAPRVESMRGGRAGAKPRIHVLSVGQGDTILLELGNDAFWLIDAFAHDWERYATAVRNYMSGLGCKSLEGLVISHFHQDHIKRAVDVISDFNPKKVVVPEHQHLTAGARRLLKKAQGRLQVLNSSMAIDHGAVRLELAPTKRFAGRSKDANEHAIVCRAESDNAVALLAADAPASILEQLIRNEGWAFPVQKKCYYKVTHHCSVTGKSPTLLQQIHPTAGAATSCSMDNRYGHPDYDTKVLVDGSARGKHRLTRGRGSPVVFQL